MTRRRTWRACGAPPERGTGRQASAARRHVPLRRVAALLVLLSMVAGLTTAAPRAARADSVAPAATGWRVTTRSNGAGIELLGIQRDDPLARGQVMVMPRSGLYRLRTVMASEQLIGGSGRDLTTNLCARVHCHAAVNGDRWELEGHDAGRLVGAAAIAGELIATQPLPPADPYAHLLVGRDGSMHGTIQFPLPLAPAVDSGGVAVPVDVNRQPMPDRTSVITRRYSTESRTPPGTVEYLMQATGGTQDERSLVPLSRRAGSGPIPASGLVVAANGAGAIQRADAWWSKVLSTGRATYRTGLNGYREVIGGSPLLLTGGTYGFPTAVGDGRHPRTMIGWDATRVWLVTVDGRQPGWSDGLTLVEAAQLLAWLGATDGLNLDGGGSTSFVGFGHLRNRPADGSQRRVAAAVVVMPPENRVATPPPVRSLDPACPPGRVPAAPFPDVAGNAHRRAIDCMAWWQLTTGTRNGTYAPTAPVRRDQMASFLARLLYVSGVPFRVDAPDGFPDDDGSPHEPFINALAELGVIGGLADGRFGPAGTVTRGQMATFLARAMSHVTGAALANSADYFADDSGNVHEPNINKLAEAAIAGGAVDGRYRASAAVRRDQMASFLARSLSLAVSAGKASPPG